MFSQSLALLGFGALINALNAPLPAPTANIANAMGFGFDPIPTAAPMVPNLFKRQAGASGSLVGYLAPDNTCGFVSGIQSSSKTCDSTQSCAAVIVSGIASMGCCDGKAGTCQFLGNCVDRIGYSSSSLCGPACQADINTLKCTEAAQPYCYSYFIPSMTMGFFSCASTFSSNFAPFATTYSGQASRAWKKVYDTDAASGTSKDPIFGATSKGGNSAGFTSAPTSSNAASTSAAGFTNGTNEKKKSAPIGAIVGGVIAGLAAIGIGVFAVIFLCIKKRNAKKNANPAVLANGNNVTSPVMQQQQQQQIVSPYQGYDPNNQQGFQNGYDPNQQGFQNQNGYPQYPQDPNQQQYGYFGGAAAVGHLNKDAKLGVYESTNSVPVSPAPQYNPSRSPPPPGMGPSPVNSNADISSPPAGYYEAPGDSVNQNGHLSTPQPGTTQQGPAPVELGGESRAAPAGGAAVSAQQNSNGPVELGANPAAPRQNAQGNHVYEMGS